MPMSKAGGGNSGVATTTTTVMERDDMIPLSAVALPVVPIVMPSEQAIGQISESLQRGGGTDDFFITVRRRPITKKGMKTDGPQYDLTGGYDVYLAAKHAGMDRVHVHITGAADITTTAAAATDTTTTTDTATTPTTTTRADAQAAHIALSKRDYLNPVRVVRAMKPYVQRHGLAEAVQMLHLDASFAKIYKMEFSDTIIRELDAMFSEAFRAGVHSTVPLQYMYFLSGLERKQDQHDIIVKTADLRVGLGSNSFRWPHNEFLKDWLEQQSRAGGSSGAGDGAGDGGGGMDYDSDDDGDYDYGDGDDTTHVPGGAAAADDDDDGHGHDNPTHHDATATTTTTMTTAGISEFPCPTCQSRYLVSSAGRVTPYREQDGVVIMEGDMAAPVMVLNQKHSEFLGLDRSGNTQPVVMTSDDKGGGLPAIAKKLKGRRFIVFAAPDTP